MRALCTSTIGLLALIHGAQGFYLPGVAPTTYRQDELVPVFVNTITPSLSSTDQQLRSVISYDCILHFQQ